MKNELRDKIGVKDSEIIKVTTLAILSMVTILCSVYLQIESIIIAKAIIVIDTIIVAILIGWALKTINAAIKVDLEENKQKT